MTMPLHRAIVPTLAGMGCLATLMCGASFAAAQALEDAPRERTLVSQGWDFHTQVPATDNFNPYAGVLLHQRNSMHYTVNESLFYTNHMTNELIPWQAESFEYNDDFTEVTVRIRDGVRWSDGEPFTAHDVAFTLEMLKGEAPEMLLSSAIDEWVASAEAEDDLTVRITLNKPGPRWAADFLATGQAARFVTVPQHIWEGEDPQEFSNFDLEQGWPVGTGPFRLVASGASALNYDRRDEWWALDAGLVDRLPEVERIVYVPATQEAMPQLYANNQIDMGRSIQPGAFDAIRLLNPNLVSWNDSGPVWGAPDGCTFALRFNTQVPPFDNADLRRAINHAIDRDQIVSIAYEDSFPKAVLPFSSYQGLLDYVEQIEERLDVEALDNRDLDRVAEIMDEAGFQQNAAGIWSHEDGSPLEMELSVAQGDPIGPVLQQQLQSAGFDTLFRVLQITAQSEAFVAGNFQMDVGPHCGSLYDPWQTLEHFHSKYAAPPGERITNSRALTRYENPELDALLDQMEQMQPSPDDEAYMDLVVEAVEIFMRDLPEITLAEEFHTLVFNTTYWTGWPSAEDPYIAPYLPWEGFARVIHNLEARN